MTKHREHIGNKKAHRRLRAGDKQKQRQLVKEQADAGQQAAYDSAMYGENIAEAYEVIDLKVRVRLIDPRGHEIVSSAGPMRIPMPSRYRTTQTTVYGSSKKSIGVEEFCEELERLLRKFQAVKKKHP